MASEDSGDKTEQPTTRRREETRRQGQVAYSNELTGSVLMLAGVLAIWLFGGFVSGRLQDATKLFLENSWVAVEHVSLQTVLIELVRILVTVVGGFMALAYFVALLINVAQVGFVISGEAIQFKPEKLDPIKGMGKIVSVAGAVRGVMQVLKIVTIFAIVYWVLHDRLGQIANMSSQPLILSASQVWDIVLELLLTVALILAVVAAADYGYQRYNHEQQLLMSRQELKDESRNEEGDPHIKGKRRQIQRELALKERMIRDVPEATVVITNPTHLAIALRYESGVTPAPICLARGKGFIAKKIVEEARRNGVPVLERKPLAQALYKTVNVGDEIPVLLYYAVSEVLAYLWRLKGKGAPAA